MSTQVEVVERPGAVASAAELRSALRTLRRERTRLVDGIVACRAQRTVPTQKRVLRTRFGSPSTTSSVEADLWRLHVRFRRLADPADHEQLLRHYASQARSLAKRFHRDREPLDDLVQVANEALILALDRFDPDRGMPFLGFANPTIIGTIKRYYRDAGWAIRVPRQVHTLSRPVREAQELLTQDLGRSPSTAEVADFLGVPEKNVRDALLATTVRSTESLDRSFGEDSDRHSGVGALDAGMARVELREALRQSLSRLNEQDQELIELYFNQELRQADIAEIMGCSQMQVSRSLRRVLRQLRAFFPVD